MKINPIHSMTNPYKQTTKEEVEQQSKKQKRDQIEISQEAKKMLDGSDLTAREKKVHELKRLIESGEYEINYKKTAEKLLAYWNDKQ